MTPVPDPAGREGRSSPVSDPVVVAEDGRPLMALLAGNPEIEETLSQAIYLQPLGEWEVATARFSEAHG
jgi:hypothetical protein